MEHRDQANSTSAQISGNAEPAWLAGTKTVASHQDIEGGNWRLSLVDRLDEPVLLEELETLTARCDHPNIFFDPAFLAHSARSVSRNKVQYLVLSEQYGETTNLRFFAPVTIERVGRIGPRFFRVWSNEFAPFGLPMIDRKAMDRTIEELCICFSRASRTIARGILVPTIPADSRFLKLLEKHGAFANSLFRFNPYERASIKPLATGSYLKEKLSGKHRQRLNAAWRKLRELGEVRVECSTELPDVEVHVLDFLFIEQRSWKGRQNTAMMNRDETRQLATGTLRDLALKRKCEVFSLYLDDTVIASVIVLNTKGHYTVWKTAFNERYSHFSAGNLLLTEATQLITARPGFRLLDSVATGDNENANRIWTDRLQITSIAMEFGNRGGMFARQIANNLSIYIHAKRWLKTLLQR